MLEEIARDDGEAAHRQLVSSLKSSNSSAFAFDMANADAAGSKTRPTGTGWEPVPVPDDFNRALNQNETTKSGEFARTPGKGTGKQLNAVQERLTFPRHSEPTTSFRFHLGGVTHNNVNGLPTPKGCISSSDNSKATVNSHSNSRQPVWCPEAPPPPSAELTTCFHTEDSLGRSNLVNTRAKIANGLFLDSCPKAVPAGETISGSMDIHIKKPGPATIFQIHSTPDRLLYRDNTDAIHTLSQQASKETYEHLIDDRMQFEQEGKPPFSIAIAQKDNLPYLTITGRSDFARFADTECDLPSFRGGRSEELAFRMVRCCDDKSSAAYLYHMPLSNFHDPNYQPDFANVKYEIDFSN
ncbi:hypothetical protein [Endozoicomonas sp. SCSIO W0465]|uniref:hypothetical protein n=1 Tax=Endozoicomonas sp. SCSIO W0465 TaxID=2918516 RepID=UPI002074AE08|nr:hypothetical protein [Endozoicomonas sp. SCSIO W0465]USE35494.1 hypothetical protein MJO57_25925 [Endozoicomonas sp. SCSIO W0465]